MAKEIVVKPETEAEYEDWIHANSDGYILNIPKSGNAVLVWHEVGCTHMLADGATRFVEGAYYKLLSRNPGALAVEAKNLTNNPLKYCEDCRANWLKHH